MHRSGGIILPVTALPSEYGIGDLGAGARRFLDFLADAGQSCWQILPMGQPSGGASGQASDIKIVAEKILDTRRKLNEYLARNTGQPLEVIEADTERDHWMSVEEAKAYGLIDEVVTSRA